MANGFTHFIYPKSGDLLLADTNNTEWADA